MTGVQTCALPIYGWGSLCGPSEVQDTASFLFDAEQVGAKFVVDSRGEGFSFGKSGHVVEHFLITDCGDVVDFGGMAECRDFGQQGLLQVFTEIPGKVFRAMKAFDQWNILRLVIHRRRPGSGEGGEGESDDFSATQDNRNAGVRALRIS